jgi:exosortase D (VPLPA-CTERM-specific)
MSARPEIQAPIYELPRASWLLVVAAVVIGLVEFQESLLRLFSAWTEREEYSHGILIPFIAGFLIWQQKNELLQEEFKGSWVGVAVVLAGAAVKAIGDMGTFYILQQYALLLVTYGLILSVTGWRVFRQLWAPLLMLVLMIPLPEFVLARFSAELQLISSQIGVWFIRLFGITVFLEGNVIDLGHYKLEVAEACSGLRYLFPLMTLSFIMAYLYKAAMWQRVAIFASSIPVTVLMNSFRIGTIGVMVEHWGTRMAEGFLHDFQGWVVFMFSTGILLLEMVLLARIGGGRHSLRDVFAVEFPAPTPVNVPRAVRKVPPQFAAGVVVLGTLALSMTLLPERSHVVPERQSLNDFPTRIDSWTGRRGVLEQVYLDVLKLDDYVIADYTRGDREFVNFYVAWYDRQSAGEATHSPRACLPGGGWHISSLDQVPVAGATGALADMRVNRVLIELGNQKQLVYYWFQQRGRTITNEYVVKLFLFWDSLTRGRTDGALVRLVTPIRTGESMEAAEARLGEMTRSAVPRLASYVPD